jgi:hypothetical protein
MLPFFRFKRKGSNEERNERTHAARSTKSIDRHAARARTRLLALQLLLADHHAGRELRRRFKSARAQRFHEGTPCCEPPNNSSPAHPRKRGREPEPGVLTRESYRLAVHIVKRHNRFTHCPHKAPAKKSQRRACCWARRTAESSPFREQKEDTTRRETTQDQPLRGAPRPEEEGSIITTETTLKLTAAH